MSKVVTKHYRQTPYGDAYTIEFRRQWDGHYDIHAIEAPYNAYGRSVAESHLYASGEVCVASGNEPWSLERAVAIAMVWMDGYSHFVRTGQFPKGSRRVRV